MKVEVADLSVPNTPHGFCGRKATLNQTNTVLLNGIGESCELTKKRKKRQWLRLLLGCWFIAVVQ